MKAIDSLWILRRLSSSFLKKIVIFEFWGRRCNLNWLAVLTHR